jgi:hypothetical protein
LVMSQYDSLALSVFSTIILPPLGRNLADSDLPGGSAPNSESLLSSTGL